MIQEFVKDWQKNRDKLKLYFETHKQEEYNEDYESLLRAVIKEVFNVDKIAGYEKCKDYIQKIDYGRCSGTLILTFARDVYSPLATETFYTIVEYGSCSGCDTLEQIKFENYGDYATKEQVKDYMQLCLNMVQEIKVFKKN